MEKIIYLFGFWIIISFVITFIYVVVSMVKIRNFSNLLKKSDYRKWTKLTRDNSLGREYFNPFGVISCILSKSSELPNEMLNTSKNSAKISIRNSIIWLVVTVISILTAFFLVLAAELS
jgi:hypothetical protein